MTVPFAVVDWKNTTPKNDKGGISWDVWWEGEGFCTYSNEGGGEEYHAQGGDCLHSHAVFSRALSYGYVG